MRMSNCFLTVFLLFKNHVLEILMIQNIAKKLSLSKMKFYNVTIEVRI